MAGWIGVDLDGTLARYGGWVDEHHIGEPMPLMVERVKAWLANGIEVRIFTARVAMAEGNRATSTVEAITESIQRWCREHIGQTLDVTCSKDYGMVELWDDRCVQVISNTGRRADGK